MENRKKEKKVEIKTQYNIILKLLKGLNDNISQIDNKFSKNKDDVDITNLAFKVDRIASALHYSLDFDNKDCIKISENLRELYRHIRFSMKLIYEQRNFKFLPSAVNVSKELYGSWSKIRPTI
tara:strand:- start:303 stop:671 length:369 start_codon:yes stop_codon:yes gene_type:complete